MPNFGAQNFTEINTMKISFLFASVLIVSLLSGCSQTDTSAEDAAAAARIDSIIGGGAAPSIGSGLPSGGTVPSGAPAAAGNVQLNPAHGEPGHKCEIAVGAPLNSAPSAQAMPQMQISPQPAVAVKAASAPAAEVKSAPTESPVAMLAKGLNPPHGSPGHDCAISVGAPLKK